MPSHKPKADQPPARPKPAKADRATVAARVEELLRLRLMGADFFAIRQYASQNGWDVSDRQLWRYIAAGDARLARTLEKDRAKLVNLALAQRADLYARALAQNDVGQALAVLKDRDALLNLYPPAKAQLTGPNNAPLIPATVSLTDAERAAAITAIYARLGAGSN